MFDLFPAFLGVSKIVEFLKFPLLFVVFRIFGDLPIQPFFFFREIIVPSSLSVFNQLPSMLANVAANLISILPAKGSFRSLFH